MQLGHNSKAIDPDQVAHELSERGMTWADANAAADLLEETKKSVLAEMAVKSQGKSQGERETIALASPEYREHVQKMVDARRAANRAKVRWEVWKTYIDLERSRHATERAAMQLR